MEAPRMLTNVLPEIGEAARLGDFKLAASVGPTGELPSLGRDTGPVSARNTSRGSLIREAHAVFHEMAKGASLEEIRTRCLNGGLLRQPAQASRDKVWNGIYWRHFKWNPPGWVLSDLKNAASSGGATDPRFVGLLYLHFARRDRLAYDFVTDRLRTFWREGRREVAPDDVLDYLADHPEHSRAAARWTDAGRRKLSRNLLSSLRDYGLFHGARRKTLQRPVIVPEVTLHLLRLLYEEGFRGWSLLDSRDWRLFLWSTEDTAQALSELAQRGQIRFERSGRTVILELSGSTGREE